MTRYYTINGQILGQSDSSGNYTEYMQDALGSVTGTTDASGNLENTYRWAGYGTQIAKTGTANDPKFLWNGIWGYRQTGRAHAGVYVRRRYYGREQAAWNTIDPLWPKQPPFSYVGGVITFVDAPGLSAPEQFGVVLPSNSPGWSSCQSGSRFCQCKWCNIPKGCCYTVSANASITFAATLPERAVNACVPGTLQISGLVTYILFSFGVQQNQCPPIVQVPINVSVTAVSGMAGSQYWRSWSIYNAGPQPPSSDVSNPWNVGTQCLAPPGTSSYQNGTERFRFAIMPIYNTVLSTGAVRDHFYIHPTSYETEGCDGIPSQQDAATIRSCLEDLNDVGLYTIPQKVAYTEGT